MSRHTMRLRSRMMSRMQKSARTGLAATASALLLAVAAGCSSDDGADSGSGGSDGGSGDGSLVLITPTPIGSNNFLALARDGAEAAGEANDAAVDVYESTDPASIQQNIDAAVRDGADIVIGVSFSVQDQFSTSAADNPDQQFLLIDACPEEQPDNLTCAVFREHESNYLAGVEAGLLTQTGAVGAVAALDDPFVHRWIDPFFAGAQSVDPAIATSVQYVGGDNPFGDTPRAKAQAEIVAGSGADHINAAASGGNPGVFEAATENGVFAFGVDTNQCPEAPGTIVDNSIKRVDVALQSAVEEILGGDAGGFKSYGLAEDGVGLTGLQEGVEDSGCLIAGHPDVLEQVAAVRDQIVSGELEVEDPVAAG